MKDPGQRTEIRGERPENYCTGGATIDRIDLVEVKTEGESRLIWKPWKGFLYTVS